MKIGVKDKENKIDYYTIIENQFKNSLVEICRRSNEGHFGKYKDVDKDWQNCLRVENAMEEYTNATFRHLFELGDDSKLEHLVATAWNAMMRLEIYLKEKC